jgi:galactitol-specific phosphotransferase system IIC component
VNQTRLLSLVLILLFAKFLYFLRIVQELGHLVHMIFMTIHDMRYFLFLMTLFVFIFTDVFYLLGAFEHRDLRELKSKLIDES